MSQTEKETILHLLELANEAREAFFESPTEESEHIFAETLHQLFDYADKANIELLSSEKSLSR